MQGKAKTIGIVVLLQSVIIHQNHIQRITILKPEHNPPVPGNRDAPHSLHLAAHRMKPVTRQIEIGRMPRLIELRKHIPKPPHLIRANSARVIAFEKSLQTLVVKCPKHFHTVPCIGTAVNSRRQQIAGQS